MTGVSSYGRSTDIWIDFNFCGHQLVCHVAENIKQAIKTNPVDGQQVPVSHFGVVLEMRDWSDVRDKLIV